MSREYQSPIRKRVKKVLSSGRDAFLESNPYGNQAQQEEVTRPKNLIEPQDQTKRGDARSFKGKVTLTFDDGPNLESTPMVLDILKKHDIKATFFVHGARVDSQEAEALLQRMRDEGHIVANHSMDHVMDTKNRAVSTSAAKETADIIAPYQDPTHPTFFRAPGGNGDHHTLNNLENHVPNGSTSPRGLAAVGWHGETNDWCYGDKTFGGEGVCSRVEDPVLRQDFVANVLHDAQKYEGGILLFHDNREYTAEHLDEVIVALKNASIDGVEDGYQFTNLDDEQTYPRLNAYARELNAQPYAWREAIDSLELDVRNEVDTLADSVSQMLASLPGTRTGWFADQELEKLRADAHVFPAFSIPLSQFPDVNYDLLESFCALSELTYKQYDRVSEGAHARGMTLGPRATKAHKDSRTTTEH